MAGTYKWPMFSKENDPDQKFHDGMFQPLIFTSWWFFTNPVEKHAQVKFDDFPNFSRWKFEKKHFSCHHPVKGVPFRFYTKHRWNLSPSTTHTPVRAPAVLNVPTLVATPAAPQRDWKKKQKSSDGWCVEECCTIIICTCIYIPPDLKPNS